MVQGADLLNLVSCLIMRFQVKNIIVFMQAPEIGLLAPDLVVYLEITPEVIYCFLGMFYFLARCDVSDRLLS